ncbi:alpha/beta fold hydrolase [Legionella fairfieldensis]|uniref:alpha/beta fold hydrolase n=1 Tax=Legionella fairfieldensis TaxID=45064 RepID=UPI00048D2838|nr:alpha/beta fold hydrolase [Legionella fairfieldensis]
MNLHIEIRGQGKPLVLFHGWGFDHRVWLPLATRLEKEYQLYLVDLPGFGLSSPMDWVFFKQKLLQQLPDSFALIGWSMGGLFATRLAIEEPSRISHLMNIATSPYFIKEQNWPGITKTVFAGFYSNLIKNPQATLSEFIRLQLNGQTYEYPHEQKLAPHSLQQGLQILAQWDLRVSLQDFNRPTCFIFGQLDAIVPRTTMEAMQKRYSAFDYFMFTKAAHLPFLSHPDELITVLRRLL